MPNSIYDFQCTYHPEVNAATICYRCKTPICEEDTRKFKFKNYSSSSFSSEYCVVCNAVKRRTEFKSNLNLISLLAVFLILMTFVLSSFVSSPGELIQMTVLVVIIPCLLFSVLLLYLKYELDNSERESINFKQKFPSSNKLLDPKNIPKPYNQRIRQDEFYIGPEKITCESCGQEIDRKDVFCSNCGQRRNK